MASYVALYRKFRPTTLGDVVGQDHIIKVLQHQIKNNQVGHAYLFCGSRGTGKTSTAKIFARAVNCLSPVNGEPCNECAICKGILSNSIPDVTELDAASNNGVDDMRAIREDVIYAPTMTKYKIYIIDEVHMLSTNAFNALLKTLEEPPEHVIFILATTEPHKIPITILSRCQRFEFKRISKEDIAKRLDMICSANNVTAEKSALLIIAQAAEGALRDAISLLDQVMSSGAANITEDIVREALGIENSEIVASMLKAIINKDITSVLSTINNVVDFGKDIKYFVWELISFARDILIYKVTQETNLLNNFALIDITKELSTTDTDYLTKIIYNLSDLESELKTAAFPSTLLEASVIQLISGPSIQTAIQAVALAPIATQPKLQTAVTVQQKVTTSPVQTTPAQKPVIQVSEAWHQVLNNLKASGKMALYASLVSTKATVSDTEVNIYFPQAFGKTVIEKPENMEIIKNTVLAITGKTLPIKCILENEKSSSITNELENTLLNSGVNVNIE